MCLQRYTGEFNICIHRITSSQINIIILKSWKVYVPFSDTKQKARFVHNFCIKLAVITHNDVFTLSSFCDFISIHNIFLFVILSYIGKRYGHISFTQNYLYMRHSIIIYGNSTILLRVHIQQIINPFIYEYVSNVNIYQPSQQMMKLKPA